MLRAQGFGFMGMSAFYASSKKVTIDQSIAVFKRAADAGVELFNR